MLYVHNKIKRDYALQDYCIFNIFIVHNIVVKHFIHLSFYNNYYHLLYRLALFIYLLVFNVVGNYTNITTHIIYNKL